MKKTLPLKAFFIFIIALCALETTAQLSENFDGSSLSSGQLACWKGYTGNMYQGAAFPGPSTADPIANNSNFSLNTTTPIAGSGSLQINGSIVPSAANSGSGGNYYSAYIPATAVVDNFVNFNFRVNSLVLPNQNYTLAILLISGDTRLQKLISPSDVGNIIPFSNLFDEFSDPGDLRVTVTLTYVNGETFTEPASFSIDIDDYTTDASVSADCNPLPVKLAQFSAQKSGTQARLDWTTTMEENSEGFFIERSADALKWQRVGFVKSHHTNITILKNYVWYDDNPLPAFNYYRLRQTDLDGSTELSRIVAVNFGNQDLQALYPNPVGSRLFISETASKIKVLNQKGHIVLQSASLDDQGMDVHSLPAGLYFIKFQKPDGRTQGQKFIKQ